MTTTTEEEEIYVAAVEGGGTTFVVSVARLCLNDDKNKDDDDDDDDRSKEATPFFELVDTHTVPSSSIDPQTTLERCRQWLSLRRTDRRGLPVTYAALGVACFGPLGLQPGTDSYGKILDTSPKADWRGVDVLGPLLEACGGTGSRTGTESRTVTGTGTKRQRREREREREIPHCLDTDVNAPAAAEFWWGSRARKAPNPRTTSLAYVTVGTGVGVGLIVNSQPVHGRMHPEGGHVCVSPLPNDDFEGYSWGKRFSPYGGRHTVEGIASSVALTERLQSRASRHESTTEPSSSLSSSSREVAVRTRDDLATVPDDDPVWDHAANAIANLCVTLFLLLSMEEVVLGGGILKRTSLYDSVRQRTAVLLQGYLPGTPPPQETIRSPTWGNDAGLVGAIFLARQAYLEDRSRS